MSLRTTFVFRRKAETGSKVLECGVEWRYDDDGSGGVAAGGGRKARGNCDITWDLVLESGDEKLFDSAGKVRQKIFPACQHDGGGQESGGGEGVGILWMGEIDLKAYDSCDKESDNSKENTDDSLEQHQMTDTETSSFESPLKVDKDWKEKFFYPANHVESVNQIEKPVKRTVRYADKSLVKEQESQGVEILTRFLHTFRRSKTKPEKKTVIPTAAKIEKPVRKPVKYAEMYRSQRPRGNQRN
ncbi:hypothetical protein Tco_0019953 [Tanacetum coccineum]